MQTQVTGIERDKNVVRTSCGQIDYDYLIVAAGIRNAYDVWFDSDEKLSNLHAALIRQAICNEIVGMHRQNSGDSVPSLIR